MPLFNPNSVKHEHIHYHYEQPKPPPYTSAKSNKYTNLKKYQQQLLSQKIGLGYDSVDSPNYPEQSQIPYTHQQIPGSVYIHQNQNPPFDSFQDNRGGYNFHNPDQVDSQSINDTAKISSQQYLEPPQKTDLFNYNQELQPSYSNRVYPGLIMKGATLQRPSLSYQVT